MPLSKAFFQHIEDLLVEKMGADTTIQSHTRVSGGDINSSYRLHCAQKSPFVKTNKAAVFPGMFEAEAKGLAMLGSCTPEVIKVGEFAGNSYLLTEWIDPAQKSEMAQRHLGSLLADIHRRTSPEFGLDYDNYIGSLQQVNDSRESWSDFFIENRVNHQLHIASMKGLVNSKIRKDFEILFTKLNELYPGEFPSLVHGDLWSGNYLIGTNSRPVLIDPAVYYGHREMDIAMTALFGGFEPDFYDAYQESFSLSPGWKERISLWNLYPLLVHVNLFGASYIPRLLSCLKNWV